MHNRKERGLRLWPALLIILVAAAALGWFWFGPEIPRQDRNIRTAITLLSAGALLVLWFILFSRARWFPRILILVLAVVGVVAAKEVLVIRGVTGDLVPIIDVKWAKKKELERPVQGSASATNEPARVEGEFTGFMGNDRSGVIEGFEIETNWVEHPPEILWRQPIGAAWSGFAVKDGLAVTQEQRGDSEYVVCYELLTGRTVWSHADEAKYSTTIAGEGPRATPTIVGDRVFTFGATGILNCLELSSGRIFWSKDTLKENGGEVPDWGMSSSPLVIDEKVVVSVGGSNGRSLVAYSADSGEIVWAEGAGGADYSSPVDAELLGKRQILIFNTEGVVSHALDGKILWKYPWRGAHPHITLPLVVSTNQVLVSSGYGTGAELIEVEKDEGGEWSADRLWKSMALKSKFAPMFIHEEHIYGLDDGIFTCVELKTGQRKWKDGRYGHGQALKVGGLILLTSEKGEMVLIQPDTEKLLELNRLSVFKGKTWNPPALAGEYLLMRNHEEAACLKLQAGQERQRIVALLFAKAIFYQ